MAALSPLLVKAMPFGNRNVPPWPMAIDMPLMDRLIKANNIFCEALLAAPVSSKPIFSRRLGSDFSALAAAYTSKSSRYYHSTAALEKMQYFIGVLQRFQTADGTVNIGNLESPPDTAFLIELIGAGAWLLQQEGGATLAALNSTVKQTLQRSGEGLVKGGVHTPNHRWVISSALARLFRLYGDSSYMQRINEWLSEGVYQDADGHYPERSGGIYATIENNGLMAMASFAGKKDVLSYVSRNLQMTLYYLEPNGEVVTTDSRRQDQYMRKMCYPYYYAYRLMAIKENNNSFAAACRFIESLPDFDEEIVQHALPHFLEMPELQQQLPAAGEIPMTYEKLLASSHLLRVRNGDTTTTVFGGADLPITIASGRSNSPNFFSFRKGHAILDYVRMSTGFFSLGYFYSKGLVKHGDVYSLEQHWEVPYYQPLPKQQQNTAGDYALAPSVDNRFWSKMAFDKRPLSNIKRLDSVITVKPGKNGASLIFNVQGLQGVPVTIELCFRQGGQLVGIQTNKDGNRFLADGYGQYTMHNDSISFGPGALAHESVDNPEGERYSTHFGNLRTEGDRVFITGITPFNYTLTLQ